MKKYFSLIITAFFLFSCSSEKPGDTVAKGPADFGSGTPEAIQHSGPASSGPFALELTPKGATRKSTLNLVSPGLDFSTAKIEWLVNGTPITPPAPTQFYAADVAKGMSIQARAVIENREVLSNVVTIMNTPPEITRVKLMPEVFKPGDTLYVEAEGTDFDDDKVTLLYEWKKNGALADKGSKLETPVKRGDKISVKVTPFDGEDYGRPAIVEREIQNLPPVIVDHKDFTFDGTTCTYQTKASDPDGDALVYSVESSQPGMTIDPGTGLLKWVVPAEFKGKQEVFINANDGHGGTARYCLRIAIE